MSTKSNLKKTKQKNIFICGAFCGTQVVSVVVDEVSMTDCKMKQIYVFIV